MKTLAVVPLTVTRVAPTPAKLIVVTPAPMNTPPD